MELITGNSIVETWCNAVKYLDSCVGREDFNVILEVRDPHGLADKDKDILSAVDTLLVEQGHQPIHTVSQTIFPDGIYLSQGTKGVFETYPDQVYPKIRKGKWGTYAHRLLRWPQGDGSKLNQLENLIAKIVQVRENGVNYKDCYELATFEPFTDAVLYNPLTDAKVRYGRQCLSHLSFKVDLKDPDNPLRLTAMYRSHYYFERLLGNLLGLAKLMGFIAKESGLIENLDGPLGPLVVHSTHARIDGPASKVVDLAESY